MHAAVSNTVAAQVTQVNTGYNSGKQRKRPRFCLLMFTRRSAIHALTGNNSSLPDRDVYAQTGHIRACITGHPYPDRDANRHPIHWFPLRNRVQQVPMGERLASDVRRSRAAPYPGR